MSSPPKRAKPAGRGRGPHRNPQENLTEAQLDSIATFANLIECHDFWDTLTHAHAPHARDIEIRRIKSIVDWVAGNKNRDPRYCFITEAGAFAMEMVNSRDMTDKKSVSWFVAYFEYAASELANQYDAEYQKFSHRCKSLPSGGDLETQKNDILQKMADKFDLEVGGGASDKRRAEIIREIIRKRFSAGAGKKMIHDHWTDDWKEMQDAIRMEGQSLYFPATVDYIKGWRDMAMKIRNVGKFRGLLYNSQANTIAHFRKHGDAHLQSARAQKLGWCGGLRRFLLECNETVYTKDSAINEKGKQLREAHLAHTRDSRNFEFKCVALGKIALVWENQRTDPKAKAKQSDVFFLTWYNL